MSVVSLIITALVFAGLLALNHLKLPALANIAIWFIAVFLFFTFGVTPPIPSAIVSLFMAITALGLFVYVVTDAERCATVQKQLTEFIVEEKHTKKLYAVAAALPLLLAGKVYMDLNVEVKSPTFARTIHPAPPNTVDFKGKTISLMTGKNPYRELETTDKDTFAAHVKNGKRVYYQNCVYCHGDNMGGDGIFAHGFNPPPADFNSPTTIPMLQEAYLFWRIAKGGPGLPDESGPWSSSMPAWEKFLTEEEIWDVIIFLYNYTGYQPRAEEEHH